MKLLAEKKWKKIAAIGIFIFFSAGLYPNAPASAQKTETKKAILGEQIRIFIDSAYDSQKRSEIAATLRKSGSYANYYIEDDFWNKLDENNKNNKLNYLNDLSGEFDQKIYPALHNFYGSEWMPGIDNDPKINIVLTRIIEDAGGYFNPNDEYPKHYETTDGKIIINDRSNERELIYLNASHLGDARLKFFLAHEFQHMINWAQKTRIYGVEEEVWLNEALSEYASTAVGFDLNYRGSNLESRAGIFLKKPSDSLTEWSNTADDYGSVNLFAQYFADHYGANTIKYILAEPQTGIKAINGALKKIGYQETFSDIFNNWTVANLLNNSYAADNVYYSYKNSNLSYINFHVAPSETFEFKTDKSKMNKNFSVRNWSPYWYAFVPSSEIMAGEGAINNLKIEFSSSLMQAAEFSVPYVVYFSTGKASAGLMKIDAEKKASLTINNFGKEAVKVVVMPISQSKISDFSINDKALTFSLNASIISLDDPVISGVLPSRGNIAGGSLLTVKGANFNKNSKIFFDNQEMANPKFVDANTIEILVPAHEQGQVDIKIINADLKDYILPRAYTYFSFTDGTLIKTANDSKVYIVNGKYKRWIQTPEIFSFYRHFDWNKIVIVSNEERDAYQMAALVRADSDYKVYEINGDNTKHWLNISAEEFNVSGRRWDMVQIINEKEKDFYATGADVR